MEITVYYMQQDNSSSHKVARYSNTMVLTVMLQCAFQCNSYQNLLPYHWKTVMGMLDD